MNDTQTIIQQYTGLYYQQIPDSTESTQARTQRERGGWGVGVMRGLTECYIVTFKMSAKIGLEKKMIDEYHLKSHV